MTVGKAAALTPEGSDNEFQCVMPCLTRIDAQRVRDHMERDEFFWLDLHAPVPEELAQLREIFGFHPLALEDTEHFGQRPKLDDYGEYVFLVFYGAWRDGAEDVDPLREVHLYISGRYLVTIHRGPLPCLTSSVSSSTAACSTPSSSSFTAFSMPSLTASSRSWVTWMTRSMTSKSPYSLTPPIASYSGCSRSGASSSRCARS